MDLYYYFFKQMNRAICCQNSDFGLGKTICQDLGLKSHFFSVFKVKKNLPY